MDKYNKKIDEYLKIYLEEEEKKGILGNIWQGAKRGLKTLGKAGAELADAALLGGLGKAALTAYGKIKAGNEEEDKKKDQEKWEDYTSERRIETVSGYKSTLEELYKIVLNCHNVAITSTPVNYIGLFENIIPAYGSFLMQRLSSVNLPGTNKTSYEMLIKEVEEYLTVSGKPKPIHDLNNLTANEFKQYFDGTYTYYAGPRTTSSTVFKVNEFLQWLHDKINRL